MTEAPGHSPANQNMAEYWNDRAGPSWVTYQQQLDGQIRILGEMAMDHAGIAAGQRVLDIGCGCGDTSLELARRVGAGARAGFVRGIDLSAPMLDHARQRAALEPALELSFEQADVQTSPLPPAGFEHAFSRFGVMFFDDSIAAFANIRQALTAEGRLSFICWRGLEENPWMSVALNIAFEFVAPPEPTPPGAPGPFALADADHLKNILARAGYGNISIVALDEEIHLSGPGTVAEAAAHTCRMGPVARVLADADEETRQRVEAALKATFTPYYDGTGVRMKSACWIACASASAG